MNLVLKGEILQNNLEAFLHFLWGVGVAVGVGGSSFLCNCTLMFRPWQITTAPSTRFLPYVSFPTSAVIQATDQLASTKPDCVLTQLTGHSRPAFLCALHYRFVTLEALRETALQRYSDSLNIRDFLAFTHFNRLWSKASSRCRWDGETRLILSFAPILLKSSTFDRRFRVLVKLRRTN